MTAKKSKSCTKPATVMVKLGDSEWVPTCDADMEKARAKSAKAGQLKSKKKGVPPTDVLPVQVRPLKDIERANSPRCLISHLGA